MKKQEKPAAQSSVHRALQTLHTKVERVARSEKNPEITATKRSDFSLNVSRSCVPVARRAMRSFRNRGADRGCAENAHYQLNVAGTTTLRTASLSNNANTSSTSTYDKLARIWIYAFAVSYENDAMLTTRKVVP